MIVTPITQLESNSNTISFYSNHDKNTKYNPEDGAKYKKYTFVKNDKLINPKRTLSINSSRDS